MSQIQIPKGWKQKRLIEICEKITDGAHKTPTYVKDGIPFLRITDIKDVIIDWNNTKKIPKSEHDELIKRCKPEFGDILYSKNGTIGVSKVVNWKNEFSIFVSLALLKPKKELVDSYFLKKFLDSPIAYKQATKRAKTATVTNLHLEEIREIKMPLPPLELQKKILKKLDYISEQLEKKKKEILQLQKTKNRFLLTENEIIPFNNNAPSIFKKILIQILNSEFEKLKNELSKKDNSIETISSICDVKGGGTPSKSNPEFWNGQIPWVSPKDMKSYEIFDTKDHVTNEAIQKSSANLIPENSVLVVFRSGILERTIPISINRVPLTLNQDMKAFIPKSNILPDFLAIFLYSCENYLKKKIV